MPRIILYKTPPPSQQPDPYLHRFEEAGYATEYIPVLKEEYQVDGLSNLLSRPGDTDGWAGVVITSKRGAEGWVKAAESCVPVSVGNGRGDHGMFELYSAVLYQTDHNSGLGTGTAIHSGHDLARPPRNIPGLTITELNAPYSGRYDLEISHRALIFAFITSEIRSISVFKGR